MVDAVKDLAFTEHALVLQRGSRAMVGVFAQPAAGAPSTAVLIVVGGPQYRVGSHRLFVQLARQLASQGHAALRIDVGGMGDSSGPAQAFHAISNDIASAVDALAARVPGGTPIVLWGLCDGASASLMYLDDSADARVRGLCLVNPWVRSDESLARARVKHYYRRRLMQREFWTKALRGRLTFGALADALRNVRAVVTSRARNAPARPSFQERMLRGWQRCNLPSLVLLSENDLTAQEFAEFVAGHKQWHDLMSRRSIRRETVADADHTFSDVACKREAIRLTQTWLLSEFLQPHPTAA